MADKAQGALKNIGSDSGGGGGSSGGDGGGSPGTGDSSGDGGGSGSGGGEEFDEGIADTADNDGSAVAGEDTTTLGDPCAGSDGDCDVTCGLELDVDCAALHGASQSAMCTPQDNICDIGCEPEDYDCGAPDFCAVNRWYGDEFCDCCPKQDPVCEVGEVCVDYCEVGGRYNDGYCDDCPLSDPDCAHDHCREDELYNNGVCDACPNPDPDCDNLEESFCQPSNAVPYMQEECTEVAFSDSEGMVISREDCAERWYFVRRCETEEDCHREGGDGSYYCSPELLCLPVLPVFLEIREDLKVHVCSHSAR